jgi:hypothetical protein
VRGTWLVAVAVVLAAVGAFLLLRRSGTETRREASEIPRSAPAAAPRAANKPNPDAPVAAAPPRGRLDPVELASPQAAVQTAVRLLESGNQDLFRDTFLPSVQPQVTADAFAACRRRVSQAPVRPDWEMAEHVTSAGRRVVRVSIFGKSMTGFHEVGGRWLADALWCIPVGVP